MRVAVLLISSELNHFDFALLHTKLGLSMPARVGKIDHPLTLIIIYCPSIFNNLGLPILLSPKLQIGQNTIVSFFQNRRIVGFSHLSPGCF